MYEKKSIVGKVKDLDLKKRIVTGYLSAFGNKDHVGDIIVKGAFTKSIAERKDQIFFLNQHNWDQPHGKFNTLQEDAKGLYFESMPLVDTTYSSDLLKLYDAGIINEHSIGFTTVKDEYDKKADARLLKELKLYEGSNVTLGANPETPFMGLKAGTKKAGDQVKRIMKMLRNGDLTDDTFALLEIALKQYETELIELGKKAVEPSVKDTQHEPSTDTQASEAIKYLITKFN
jgi:HK97 family phage prohead protease